MSLYKLMHYTNIHLNKPDYGGLTENTSHKKCINALLKANFTKNKRIHPNTLTILTDEKKISIDDGKFVVLNERKNYELNISYQLTCEYYLVTFLRKELKHKNIKMFNWFFEKYKNKYMSKNTNVEQIQNCRIDFDGNYRTDFNFEFPNDYKIIIEINEQQHEKVKETDMARARAIIDNNPKIKKFYFIREVKFNLNLRAIRKFVKKELVPLIIKLGSLDDEKTFVVNELLKSSDNNENYRKICELMYDSHKNGEMPITNINVLNKFHDVNFNDAYIDHIARWCHSLDESNHTSCEANFDDSSDDILSDSDYRESGSDSEDEKTNDYYIVNNGELILTWLGLNAYYRFIHNHIAPHKDNEIFKFFTNMTTNYINIILKSRLEIMTINDTSKIWGFLDDNYSDIM